jgi:hypothetical protein
MAPPDQGVCDGQVPTSPALRYAGWAKDPKHVHAAEWLARGQKTESLSLTGQRIAFDRQTPP